ncbi:pR77 [rat cytomegalovirus strain Maastricht]|uniref:PR77 n=1 Tax=Rat cytomegalovirus (strain Maastricht) TaxID=79700 RepID=Q9DWC3_RCMVM|nr:pR77 [rat cytomegalovirus strain Maastricht]AAF99167.1 pR77 [rat cytomegalovirus strain Maastricht]WEG71998.1 DNA packaging tegument protein UL25 [Murid betaherpesvirus 2]
MARPGASTRSLFSISSGASRRPSSASSARESIASPGTPSSISSADGSIPPLRPYHVFPCVWAYEAHARNELLCCSRETFARLRDDAALRLRQRAEDLAHDARLRRRAGRDVEALGEELRAECKRFRERIGEAERLLAEPLAAPAGVEGGEADGAARGAGTAAAGDGGGRDDAEAGERRALPGPAAGERNRFWIAAVDPPITFVHDFRGEVVDTLYNVGQTWTFSFGAWYYRQKRWFFNQHRWRRTYRLTQLENLAVSQELLMGVLNAVEQLTVYPAHDAALTDLEVAVVLLAAYRAALEPRSERSGSVDGLLLDCSRTLRSLADDVAAEVPPAPGAAHATSFFAYRDPPGMRFYAPVQQGRRYAPGTFDEHVLVAVLIRRGVISSLPGSSRLVSRDVSERMTGTARDDLVALWTFRLFGHRFGGPAPVIVSEQHYLRSGLTALAALLLLWKVLNSESVFVAGRAGRFSLKDVFPEGLGAGDGEGGGPSASSPSGVVGEEGFSARNVKNFEFLIERYVVPWYAREPAVTVSQLFPGLLLLAYCESHRAGWDLARRSADPAGASGGGSSALHVQPSKVNPLLEYMMLQATAASDRDVERLAAHDYALFHCENGLGRFLSAALPRHRVLAVGGQLFNVQSVYDCLYFFVLGFLPVINVT